MRFLLVAILISAFSEGYVGLHTANSYINLEQRKNETIKYTDHQTQWPPQKFVAEVDEEKSKEKTFQGWRCDQTLYSQNNLKVAADEACLRIRSGKKTWSFQRFPVSFPNDSANLIGKLSENPDAENMHGPFYLYPLMKNGEPFKYGIAGHHRVVTNRKCEVVAAVVQVKSRTKCKGFSCFNIFRKEHTSFRQCYEDYR